MVYRAVGLVLLGAGALWACRDEDSPSPPASGDDAPRYEARLTVLESPEHGPELCFNVEDSSPPQCGGLPLSGWDWAEVDGEDTASGTTWGEYHVVGTYDGTLLTLTETPSEATIPSAVGHSRADALEHQGAMNLELDRVREELFDADSRASLGVQGGYRATNRGVMVAHVWVADEAATAYAQDRWGDLVELQGILQPVR